MSDFKLVYDYRPDKEQPQLTVAVAHLEETLPNGSCTYFAISDPYLKAQDALISVVDKLFAKVKNSVHPRHTLFEHKKEVLSTC